jgi:hypothetical protein
MLINLFDTMPNKKALDEALNKKFISKDKFAEEIEGIVLRTQLNYIDAIVQYCEQNDIEIETVNKLVSKPLKEKLKAEAMHLNFLKPTSKGKLPV